MGERIIRLREFTGPAGGRNCIHVKTGRTGIPKECAWNYECRHCAFDQWMDAVEETDRSRLSGPRNGRERVISGGGC